MGNFAVFEQNDLFEKNNIKTSGERNQLSFERETSYGLF